MPLPWLIGAAVVGLGAAIAAAVKDDGKPSSSNSNSSGDDAEQRRRREAAEQERKKRERDEKIAAAHALFQEQGEQHRASLRKALDDVACVIGDGFKPRLTANGVVFDKKPGRDDSPLASAVRAAFPEQHDDIEAIVGNLHFYTAVCGPDFPPMASTRLERDLADAHDIAAQFAHLDKARTRLLGLKQELANAA